MMSIIITKRYSGNYLQNVVWRARTQCPKLGALTCSLSVASWQQLHSHETWLSEFLNVYLPFQLILCGILKIGLFVEKLQTDNNFVQIISLTWFIWLRMLLVPLCCLSSPPASNDFTQWGTLPTPSSSILPQTLVACLQVSSLTTFIKSTSCLKQPWCVEELMVPKVLQPMEMGVHE